jgi:cellulose synthase operon protein C
MKRLALILLCICLPLGGCSWFGGRPHGKTLADLESPSIPANKRQLKTPPRNEVVQSYQALLKVIDDPALKAIVLHRVADLTMLSSEDTQLSAENAEDQTKAFYQIAITSYETLLKQHPEHPGLDAILYQLAKAYELNGELEKVIPVLDRLVQLEPRSQYYAEAQFRRGEYLFNQRYYPMAEEAYVAAEKAAPQGPFVVNAIYMAGWSQYKQNRDTDALTTFVRVLDHYLKDQTRAEQLPRADQELLDDTLRVMSLQFADAESNIRVEQLFQRVGRRSYEPLIYTHLGQTLFSKQRYKDAADVYAGFIQRNPQHPESPAFHEKIIHVYIDGKFPSLVVPEKEAYVKAYGVDSAYWKTQTEATRNSYIKTLTQYINDLAQYHHGLAQRTKKPADYAIAARWYQQLLRTAPAAATAPGTAFLIGETLYEAHQYTDAAQAYEHCAYQLPAHAQSAEAGYAALQAWEQAIKGDRKNTAWAQQQLASAAKFGERFADHPRAPDVALNAAETWMKRKDYPHVQLATDRVLRSKHASAEARRSAHALKAQAAFDQGDFLQAESAYQAAAGGPSADKETSQALRDSLAASIYKQGEQLQQSGDKAGAVAQFLRIGSAAPGASIQANAEYDAATLLLELKEWAQAIRVLENFKQRHSKHPLTKDIPAKLAFAYQNAGQINNAAGALEQMAQTNNDSNMQRTSLWQAATLYEQANDMRNAARAYENYVRAHPKPFAEAMEARHKLSQLYTQLGDSQRALTWQKDIVQQEAQGGSARNARSKTIAAEAALALAAVSRTQFEQIKLTLPLERSFKTKKTALESALKAYTHVAAYGIQEYATAANYYLGEIYAQLSRDLLASQRPAGFDELELEQYNVLLEEQAFPFEEKAIEIHLANTNGMKQGIYNNWTQKSLNALAKLMPGRYNKTEKIPQVSHAIH